MVQYLATYGNTRECDLVNYCVQKFDHPSKDAKKTLHRMAIKGKIHRIVHNKLKPPEVYISLYESLPATFQEELYEEDVRKILLEAQTIVEQRGKDKLSGLGDF